MKSILQESGGEEEWVSTGDSFCVVVDSFFFYSLSSNSL